jgi:predicted acylesterase/phospholipase RssA
MSLNTGDIKLDAKPEEAKPEEAKSVKNLVLSGGGTKGYCYFGVYKALTELKLLDELENYAGNSIGSAFILMMALKFSAEELLCFVDNFDYHNIKDVDMMNILTNWGVETGDKLVRFLKALIKTKLKNPHATFKDLHEYNPIGCHIIATHVNTYTTIVYNHINTPDEPLYLAVRKSMGVPLIVKPVKEGQDPNDMDYYVDGGIRNNFPIDLFPDSTETVGFLLEDCSTKRRKIQHAEDYIMHLLATSLYVITAEKIKLYKNTRIIHLVQDVGAFDIGMTKEDRQKLYQYGYDKTIEYFNEGLKT